MEGASVQTSNMRPWDNFESIQRIAKNANESGIKWVVSLDEPGSASVGVSTDDRDDNYNQDDARLSIGEPLRHVVPESSGIRKGGKLQQGRLLKVPATYSRKPESVLSGVPNVKSPVVQRGHVVRVTGPGHVSLGIQPVKSEEREWAILVRRK